MANEEASPICRGKNLSWETILLFYNNMPREAMPKAKFHSFIESKINGWTQTHSQIARQLAFYYEKEGICYPRFTATTKYVDLFAYVQNWATKYFIPNPYTPSLRSYNPVCIYSHLKRCISEGLTDFDEALDSMFDVTLNSHDKVNVYLSNFTDLVIDSNHKMSDSDEISEEQDTKEIGGSLATDIVEYYNYFNLEAIKEKHTKQKISNGLPLQQIFYGAPGTGKSHGIKKKEAQFAEVIRTTFHPDSDYSTFVGAYKPTMKRTKKCVIIDKEEREINPTVTKDEYEERISYTFVKQAFLKAYIAAWKGLKEGKNILLVIEEINRGNCAQIFGDLFQLLDRESNGQMAGYSSYPISADEDLRQVLEREFAEIEDMPAKVKSGEELLLPKNLFIWATMNTSDQSLFPIDSAFKRRWDWKYVPISNKAEMDYSIEVDGTHYDWWDFLSKVNTAIGKTTESEDKKLGYFFCKADKKVGSVENNVISADRFVSKAIFYIWNDVMKDFDPMDVKFDFEVEKEDGSKEVASLSLMTHEVKSENGDKRDEVILFSDFFQGAGDINLDTVKQLMTNLQIKIKERKEVENSGSDESATAGTFQG